MREDKRPRAVWLICQYAGSPRHGMNYRPYNLGRELAARGLDVTVISGSYSHQFYAPPEVKGPYTLEEVDGLRYCWVRTPRYPESQSAGRLLSFWVFVRALYGLARQAARLGLPLPGAVIVSSPSPYPILPARRLASRYGARLVFEVRDLWPLSLVELGRNSPRHPFVALTQLVEDFAYRHAERVVSVLPAAEAYMRGRGLAEGKFRYIPNGVKPRPEGEGGARGEASLVRDLLPGRAFIVGYAGSLGLANALSHLVEAAVLLRDRVDIGIAIVGEGAELAALKALAAERGLENIVFVPAIAKTGIPALLSEFDACYLGLRREPLFRFGVSPTKLFDYLLAAKPVIMAIEAGNDIVSEAGCGLTVRPEDPAAIAAAILDLAARGAEERRAMGEAGRAYVKAKHDWSILGDNYLEVLGL